jgi:hypothetical protein
MAVFAFVALFYTGLTFVMYLYDIRSAPWLMWETRHLLHRTWLMDVYGLRPYTEVSAEYGPILTYAPLYMYWLLKPLGASHELAYFACHLFLNLAGLWCVYYVLSRAIMPPRARAFAFGILAVAGFAPYMGINGVLVRYLFPFTSLLLGHRAVVWTLSRPDASTLSLLALQVCCCWLGMSCSPRRRDWPSPSPGWVCRADGTPREDSHLAVSLIALITRGAALLAVSARAYYETLLRFSEGRTICRSYRLRILVLYIVTLFIVVPLCWP